MSTDTDLQFSQLGLAAPILKAVQEVGYEAPSPIQAQSIPPLLEGRDLLGQAQTGTGKTAAFALPLLSRLDVGLKHPQMLVLAPTRELAIQVAEAMQTYARHLKGFHILPIYGGQSMGIQLKQLRRGAQVIVGTPGRVLDHLNRKTLKLDKLTSLVLDEADEMLRMGFIDDVETILDHSPDERQVVLFSATMPDVIRRVANKYLKDPIEIRIKNKTATVSTVDQRYWQVSGTHKLDALTRILEAEDFQAMIIFVRTKTSTVDLAEKLEARGYSTSALNGDMNQPLREKAVNRLKKGTLDIIVATDVAARGLDVERITHVINYDIPNDTEAYVHRIGRTGRAGRKGSAILFVAPREKRMLRSIERATRQAIEPMTLPSRNDIKNRRVIQFKELISETLESQNLSFFEEVIDGFQQEKNVGMSEVCAALTYLLQKDRPLQPVEKDIKIKPQREREPGEGRDARGRPERGERSERGRGGDRERKPRRGAEDKPSEGMQRFRIEVGRDDGVQPKHIVGAIANEAGLDSYNIGQIKLHESYSTVDLPSDMPREVFKHLRKVWVCSKQLQITKLEEGERAPKRAFSKADSGDKPLKVKRKKNKSRPPTE
ncbi:MAG: DEAD/DEAH box helicase [Gammaproteobacteria bacterium]|nr:DEAD/DEAH box helicase [Gammaproteobacteria bacterium]